MELRLVADTNLFFECKALDQLPWSELGHDPIVILLTKPVLDEIDKHKKSSGRTRERALEIFGIVRSMLSTNQNEAEVRSSGPRVVIRLSNARPDASLKDELDYSKNDERLVGIVSSLITTGDPNVRLFTDDTGPASTANGHGLPFQMIAADWKRPPTESTEVKKIKELEKDLRTYRAQEPQISIDPCEGAGPDKVISVTRRVANALAPEEIDEIIASLCVKHPLKVDFAPPERLSIINSSGETVHTDFVSPEDKDIIEYRDISYPRWIAECRRTLEKLHQGRDEDGGSLIVRWPMRNVGTRPALKVRVEFVAKGPLKLARVAKDDGANEEVADKSAPARHVPTPKLSSPPAPPPFRKIVTRVSPPAGPRLMNGMSAGLASMDTAKLLGNSGLARSVQALERASLLSPAQRYGLGSASAAASRLLGQTSKFESLLDNTARVFATPVSLEAADFRAPTIRTKFDAEKFYWDWPARRPVKVGELTCDLWRHQNGEQIFEFEVLFDENIETRGSIECRVHAENLTRPEEARCIVARVIEQLSVRHVADAMVEACT